MGDARRQPAPNTSTVKALRAFVGGGCLRRHRQARSPTRRSTAAHPRARATMHDTADTSRPATGQPSPPFAGPSSDRQRDAQEPHGRPDGPRASHRRHRSTTCRQPRHRPAPSRRHRLRRRDPLARARQTAPYVRTWHRVRHRRRRTRPARRRDSRLVVLRGDAPIRSGRSKQCFPVILRSALDVQISCERVLSAHSPGAAQPHPQPKAKPTHDRIPAAEESHRTLFPAFCSPPVRRPQRRAGATAHARTTQDPRTAARPYSDVQRRLRPIPGTMRLEPMNTG